MEIAKMKVLEALLSKLGDDNATTSGGMSWKSGFEAGFQAGFQQGIALTQLPIQQAQPKPAVQSPYSLQHAVPFSSPPPMFISPNVPHGQQALGKTTQAQAVTIHHNYWPPLILQRLSGTRSSCSMLLLKCLYMQE